MNERWYEAIVRWLTAITGIALGIVSFYFSASGFGIRVPEAAWIGYVFGVSIIIIEMAFKQRGFNHQIPMIIIGLLAYAYGLWSNYIGLQAIMTEDDKIFTGLVAAFLEITPEFLLVWALMGDRGLLSSRSRFIPNLAWRNTTPERPSVMNRSPLPMRPNGNGRRMPTGHPFEK